MNENSESSFQIKYTEQPLSDQNGLKTNWSIHSFLWGKTVSLSEIHPPVSVAVLPLRYTVFTPQGIISLFISLPFPF